MKAQGRSQAPVDLAAPTLVARRSDRPARTPRPHEKAKRPEPATTTENQDPLSHNDSVGPARPASSAVVP